MPEVSIPDSVADVLGVATWLLFAGGVVVVLASWANRIPQRYGWVGAWMTITGGAMSWVDAPGVRLAMLGAGAVIIALQLAPRRAKPALWTPRQRSFRPWDQEAELLRLCHGDKSQVERLIRGEIERNPKLSRAGAALAAATRLRHDK